MCTSKLSTVSVVASLQISMIFYSGTTQLYDLPKTRYSRSFFGEKTPNFINKKSCNPLPTLQALARIYMGIERIISKTWLPFLSTTIHHMKKDCLFFNKEEKKSKVTLSLQPPASGIQLLLFPASPHLLSCQTCIQAHKRHRSIATAVEKQCSSTACMYKYGN